MPQETRITTYRGQFVEIPAEDNLRWPYHAKVMKTLLTTSNMSVSKAVFIMMN